MTVAILARNYILLFGLLMPELHASRCNLQFARFFAICLGQETAKLLFRSSSQAVTCYYQSNHSKLEAISLSAWPRAQH